jgi:cholesterol 7-desaturase
VLDVLQEIPENGADVAHLSQVHGPIMTAGVEHDWSGQWNQHTDPEQAHVGILSLLHRIKLFGVFVPVLDLKVEAHQVSWGRLY